ncbi:coiled-coil domain-containing protein [Gordonibacter urolithinfaciens]|uniref:coiled-coil domain-containing protein n=1 Tax=Gordonibacter urolithinfaciens TaxID=1335613 RepID=UPI003A93F645
MQHSATKARAKGALAGFVAASLAASLMIPSLAFAEPTSAEKQAEAQSALASLNAMQEKLEQTAIAYDEAVAAQEEAEANRNEAQARIDEATGQIADLQDHLGTRARSMYRTGNSTLLDLLFGSTTFAAFATNWDLLNTLNQNDADLVQQTKDLRAEVQEQEAVLAEQERIAKEKADEAKRSKDETAGTIASMQATYDSLSAEAAALLEQERAAQQAAEAAKAQDVVDASIQQATGGNTGNTGGNPGYTPSPSPGPSYDEAIADTVVGRAYSQIGKAYGYGDPSYGAGPNEYDCSGFVSFCLSGSYSRMGSTSTFMGWPTVSDPQPGDVCVNSGHCGIYIGNNQMIHAATYGVGVVIGPVQAGMKIVRP